MIYACGKAVRAMTGILHEICRCFEQHYHRRINRFEQVTTMKDLGTGADRGGSLLKEQRQAVPDLSEIHMDASVSYLRTVAT